MAGRSKQPLGRWRPQAPLAAGACAVPYVPISFAETPLHLVPRLAEAIGLERLWVKRDDNTGLALGGNKARKLDFLVAHALERGSDVLVTTGAPQSNHCRMTAAAAARFGLECHLVFMGGRVPATQGNLMLDGMLGASWEFVDPGAGSGARALAMASRRVREVVDELTDAGHRPYAIPVGGMNGRGTLGYVKVAFELAMQFRAVMPTPPSYIFATLGSGGTTAGLALGLALAEIPTQVVGVCPVPGDPVGSGDIATHMHGLIAEAAEILALPVPAYHLRAILDTYGGVGYGKPTEASTHALELVAQTEGILLDPVYTAKSFAGLIGEVARGAVGPSDTVVFLHTGGAPALFADRDIYWP